MRVYNGTDFQLNLPLTDSQRISISPHSVSGDIMPSTEFLSLLVSSYDYSEIALIVSGPFEITMCSSVSGSVGFVVQTLEEAIERFAKKNNNDKDSGENIKKEVSDKPSMEKKNPQSSDNVCNECKQNPCTCETKSKNEKTITVDKLSKDSILDDKKISKESVIDRK